jgi:ribosomal protein L7/L12
MRLEKITVAQNGFIVEDWYGHLHIAKTLLEAAQIVGEAVPNPGSTCYSVGFDSNDLNNVKYHFREGHKIEAIKVLRNCFTPRLGLKEAKDLVEQLCG